MTATPRNIALVLDTSVVDHLHRVDVGTYKGANETALRRVRASAEQRKLDIWVSEITGVEMLHGLENLAGREAAQRSAATRDAAKDAITNAMGARRLGYPCSRFDDTYSRLDRSFRFAGPHSAEARRIETELLSISGVSEGDARQIVSCAFPFDGDDTSLHPVLDWFVTEDHALVIALSAATSAGRFPELAKLRCGSSGDVVAAHPELF